MRSRRLVRRIAGFLATLLIATGVAAVMDAQPASAHHQFAWFDDEGTDVRTFGPNAGVSIYMGAVEFACDFFFPTADIYVVNGVPADGATLVDAGGGKNTVLGLSGGLIADELIAVTKPAGKLGEGTYSIVFDECQDGKFNAGLDAVQEDSIIVDFPPGEIPPLDPAIAQLKADSGVQAAQWLLVTGTLDRYEQLQQFQSQIECLLGGLAVCAVSTLIDALKEALTEAMMESLGLVDPKKAARDVVDDLTSHYLGIKADPPDPAFETLTALDTVTLQSTTSTDPFEVAMVAVGNATATESALAEALLHAVERYQGADAADDPAAALQQAQAIKIFAAHLAANSANTNAALALVRDAITGDPRDFDAIAARVAPVQDRITAEGFSTEQQAVLANLGVDEADASALATAIATPSVSGFTEAGSVSSIDALIAQNTSAAAHLQTLASTMNGLIATILGDPNLTLVSPTAEANGPYGATEGVPTTMSAAGSEAVEGPLTYAWDLDRDGDFDDATGPAPAATFPRAFSGLIGLRVTDTAGRHAVDYARVNVGDANAPPVLGAITPTATDQLITVGDSRAFSVTPSDPNADEFTVRWLLDGLEVATGNSYTLTPTDPQVGPHALRVVVSDGVTAGGARHADWGVRIVRPDVDADGWSVGPDCDDGDAAVNPGRPEVQGNGVDDDCDDATTDEVVNDPPVVVNISTGTLEDVPVIVTLAGSDPEDDPLTWSIVTPPAEGSLGAVSGDGLVTFTPAANFSGTTSFTYLATDDGGLSSAAKTVTVTVLPDNDEPVAAAGNATTMEDQSKAVTLQGFDPDPDSLTYTVVDEPDHGALTGSGATRTYTPTPDFNGTDTFTFEVSDGTTTSAAATFTIDVTAVNDAPTAEPVAVGTNEDTAVPVTLAGTDVDGDTLTFLVVSAPTNGTFVPSGGGGTYTPSADFAGTATFTYLAVDGLSGSSPATVTVTVAPVNDAPTVVAVEAATGEDQPVVVVLQGRDVEGTGLTYSVVDPPAVGTLSSVSGRRVTYTPPAEFAGVTSFTYRVSDGGLFSTTAMAAITVLATNDAPVAFDDAAATVNNQPTIIDVVANDTDVDGGARKVLALGLPERGAANVLPDGRIEFSPAYDYTGTTDFTYTVSDGRGGVDEATVTVLSTEGPVHGKTFTNVTDFGPALLNVEGAGPNTLRLKDQAGATDRFWVAVSLGSQTILKLDTTTGAILGEYQSAPDGLPRNPSRTTVDLDGNVWATNRDSNSVVHIGQPETGTCVDRNENGTIETSSGADDVLSWPNTGGIDTDGGVETATDECILHFTRTTAGGTRHVSVTAGNDVWVSGFGAANQGAFDLIDGETGLIVRSEAAVGYGGYGGLIDGNGVIWSARRLLRWDTANPLTGPNGGNWQGYEHDSYGLCLDRDGNVWNTALEGNIIRKFAPDGSLVGTFDHGFHYAQGCVADAQGDIWVAHSILGGGSTVGHLTGDGTWIGNVAVGSGPTGVAVDGAGKVWSTNYNAGTVSRIDPDGGPVGADGETAVGIVDFTSGPLGGNPYNYSDMTGSTLVGAPENGSWTAVYDSGEAGADWSGISYDADTPDDATLTVTVATSEDGTAFGLPVPADAAAPLTVDGRYLRVRVQFNRSSEGISPTLSDLTVWTAPPPPPTAEPGEESTDEDVPVGLQLLGALGGEGGGDPQGGFGASVVVLPTLSFEIIGDGPSHGTLSALDGNALTYTPDPDYNGPDGFYFRSFDGSLRSKVEFFALTVGPVNDPPTAVPVTATTPQDVARVLTLSGSDIDGDVLTFQIVSGPTHGTLGPVSGGQVTYSPSAGYAGPDAFTFVAHDGTVASPVANATLTVTPVTVTTTPAGGGVLGAGLGRDGYLMVAGDGGVFASGPADSFGNANFVGAASLRSAAIIAPQSKVVLNAPVVGGAVTQSRNGYWLAAADGGVFAIGDAVFAGSLGATRLNEPIVGIAADPDGNGYWMVARDGGVFAFGATFHGSMGGIPLNFPIVDIAATPTGRGYWLVASDGGVFAFGDAAFSGSLGATPLNKAVVSMAADKDGSGYYLVAADGGVFTFGSAFHGSAGAMKLNSPVVGLVVDPDGVGYWLAAADGGIFSFAAPFHGSVAHLKLNEPMAAVVGT